MIQLSGRKPDGTPVYYQCFTGVEMTKLIFEGVPMVTDLTQLEGGTLTIVTLYGRTEQDIVDYLMAQGIQVSLPVEAEQS